MTHPISNDPEHWHAQAAEARAMAEQITDAKVKQAVLKIAKSYEELAEHLKQGQSENGQAAKPD